MLTHYNLVANVQMCKAWMYKLKDGRSGIRCITIFPRIWYDDRDEFIDYVRLIDGLTSEI